MRVVADTNVLISGLLWLGKPHKIILAAESRRIALYTSPFLVDELLGVLARPKFKTRLIDLHVTVDELLVSLLDLAHLVRPTPIPPVVLDDPEDDHVLSCALAISAAYIVSGDSHLLKLISYRSIPIVSPHSFVTRVLHH
ncbi:MAG: putative toxin-antitoxin system toxin component, PIN family [Candidatus Omnitrophica bacterium]|nr:putative toxin-antitoxin system toxin component, PIN family [Candidatus Omnitrophota bacterium]